MSADPAHPRERLLDAAYATFETHGVSAGTMRRIAQEAGVGRATLYRHFPGKDVLLAALVLREARSLFAVLDAELGTEEDPQTLFERGLLKALSYLRGHTLLRRVLKDEPEAILPFLTVRAAPLLEAAVDFAAPYIERAVKAERIAPIDPRMAAEWAARILLSLVVTPSVVIDLDDPRELTMFVRWLVQGVQTQGDAR